MMLANNVRALESVSSLAPDQILTKIASVRTAGAVSRPVNETLVSASCVVCALDNADCTGSLAEIVCENPAGVAAGIAACLTVTGAERALVVLPTSFSGDVSGLETAFTKLGVAFEVDRADMVDARLHADDAKVHLVTLAAIAQAISDEPGAGVVCIDGHLAEVVYGAPLRTVVAAEGARLVRINHSFLPVSELDEPLEPELALGDGSVVTLGEHDCIVHATVEALVELRTKSCGKCTFCREGLYQLWSTFSDIEKARAKAADLDLVRELCDVMPISSNCSLGEVACRPVSSALSVAGEEIDAHLRKHSCPAGQCASYLSVYVDPQMCQGCGDCIDACPVGCIEGKDGFISMIDEFDCTKCGACVKACPEGAVKYAEGRVPPLPERLTRVGRFRRR